MSQERSAASAQDDAPKLTTKAARHAQICALIGAERISSQTQLRQRLAQAGIHTTQGTLSRDLVDLGAVRARSEDGQLVYTLANQATEPAALKSQHHSRLSGLCKDLLLSVAHAENDVVLRTPPGAAQFLASAIDQAQLEHVLGTIAGDDTILLITTGAEEASLLAGQLVAGASRAG